MPSGACCEFLYQLNEENENMERNFLRCMTYE